MTTFTKTIVNDINSQPVFNEDTTPLPNHFWLRADGVFLCIFVGQVDGTGDSQKATAYSLDGGATWATDAFTVGTPTAFSGRISGVVLSTDKVQTMSSPDTVISPGDSFDHHEFIPCGDWTLLSNVDMTEGNSFPVYALLDSINNIYFIQANAAAGGGGFPNFILLKYDGTSWSVLYEHRSSFDTARSIAFDINGLLHLTLTHNRGRQLFYSNFSTNDFLDKEVNVQSSSGTNFFTSKIVVDSTGVIHIARILHLTGQTVLFYSNSSDGGLSFTASEAIEGDGNLQANEFLSIDRQDTLHLTYHTNGYGNFTSKRQIKYLKRPKSTGVWSTPELVTDEDKNHENYSMMGCGMQWPTYQIPTTGACGLYSEGGGATAVLTFWKTDDFVPAITVVTKQVSFCLVDPNLVSPGGNDPHCPFVEDGQVRKMVDTVTGLDHLEGEVIEIQMDGILPTDSTGRLVTNSFTVSGGSITLPQKAAVVHAGASYDGVLQLLKNSDGSIIGTGQTKMRRVYLTVTKFLQSLGLKVGPDEDNLSPIFPGIPGLPLFTGDQRKLPYAQWNQETEMIFKMEDPLPCLVQSILLESEVEEK